MTEPTKKPVGRPATGQVPGHGLRMPDDRWRRVDEVAKTDGTTRTQVLNDFAKWYTREPGAKAVKRPPAPDGQG